MTKDLLNIIPAPFQDLFADYGFKLLEAKKFDTFGGEMLIMGSTDFLLRFEKEMGRVLITISSTMHPDKVCELVSCLGAD